MEGPRLVSRGLGRLSKLGSCYLRGGDDQTMDDEPMELTRAVQAVRPSVIWDFTLGQVGKHRVLVRMLLRFALVGGSGYLVYQAILFAMYDSSLFRFLPAKDTGATIVFFTHGDVRLLITTLIATAVVLVWVFTGHNFWTFRDRNLVHKPVWLRFGQFVPTALTASAIVAVTVNVVVLQFDTYHFVALPIGIALAGVWDLLWYTRLIWRRDRKLS